MSPSLAIVSVSRFEKVKRLLWNCCWTIFYRPSPTFLHGWRCFLLKSFGATVGKGVHAYPSSRVWAPWNLTMGSNSCLGPNVICYNIAHVYLGENAIVSQYCHLCTASHDYTRMDFPLIAAPIRIGRDAWLTADVFVGPGVNVDEGAVVNARSSVFSNIEAWTVAKGCPAKAYKKRVLKRS